MKMQTRIVVYLLGLALLASFAHCQQDDDDDDDLSAYISIKSSRDPSETPELAEGMVSRRGRPIVNTINGREFPEPFSIRCGKPMNVDLPPEQVPELVLIRNGGESNDKTIKFEADEAKYLEYGFDPEKNTTIFIPGWTQTAQSEYVRQTRKLIASDLQVADRGNYLIFDWGRASQEGYPTVAAKLSVVANYLAILMEKMIDLGNDRNKIHLVSHSLGVPLSGFAGRRIRPPIGRITALDPADPCFKGTDRLVKGDARQVVVHHFDKLIGSTDAHGDVDIFVNGGYDQPGCPKAMKTITNALANPATATHPSHDRSVRLTTKALVEGGCQQVAYECEDYQTFLAGLCADCGSARNEKCFVMGLPFQYASHPNLPQSLDHTTGPKSRKFFIRVGDNERFCSNQYQILVEFEPSNEVKKWKILVELDLEYEYQDGRRGETSVRVETRLDGNRFAHLFVSDEEEQIKFVGAKMRAIGLMNKPITICGLVKRSANDLKVKQIVATYMSTIEPEVKAKFSSRLCTGNVIIDQKLIFETC